MSKIDPETCGVLMVNGLTFQEVELVCWHARRLGRLRRIVSRPLTSQELKAEKKSMEIIKDVLAKHNIKVVFGDGARGAIVRAILPSGHQNAWKAEGWVIE